MQLRLRLVSLPGFDHYGPARAGLERDHRRLPGSPDRTSRRAAADDSWSGMALAEDGTVTATAGKEHTADRPSWDCRACDKPWPCDPAREALATEMDRVALAIFMWLNFEEAADHLTNSPAGELFERFIAWTHAP